MSPISKSSFIAKYGDLPNVKWKRHVNFDEAIFTKDGHEIIAYYDSDGSLDGTTSYVTFTDLPTKGQKNIKTQYKDYSIGPIIFFIDNAANQTDMLLYGIQFEEADSYFVELSKGDQKIVLQVNPLGEISFFKKL